MDIDYIGTLEAAHTHIDDDWYDMVKCDAAGKLNLNLIKSSTTLKYRLHIHYPTEQR